MNLLFIRILCWKSIFIGKWYIEGNCNFLPASFAVCLLFRAKTDYGRKLKYILLSDPFCCRYNVLNLSNLIKLLANFFLLEIPSERKNYDVNFKKHSAIDEIFLKSKNLKQTKNFSTLLSIFLGKITFFARLLDGWTLNLE